MPIKEKFVLVSHGTGGPLNDSIPVYSDDKAPRGDQLIITGKQLMLPNGFELICVDPAQLIEGIDKKDLYFNKNGYARVWRIGQDGHGADIVPGKQSWVEYSHLVASAQEPEEPDEELSYADIGRALETLLRFVKNIFSG